MAMCAGVQKLSRPMERCQETSQCAPIVTEVTARAAHQRFFGGALVGMALRRVLPEDHLTSDAKDVVKLAMGLIATMAALVLGMLVSTAKSS